jgi:hypothetical protein
LPEKVLLAPKLPAAGSAGGWTQACGNVDETVTAEYPANRPEPGNLDIPRPEVLDERGGDFA